MRSKRQFFSGVPFSLAVAALAALASNAPAQTAGTGGSTWKDSAARWRDKVVAHASELQESAAAFVDKHLGDQPPMVRLRGLYRLDTPAAAAPAWHALAETELLPERAVLLVHGLDEIGDLWNDLAPALAADPRLSGAAILRFEYPNDQAIALSADELDAALGELFLRGTRRVDLVCHSMGGLVARDVLTRDGLYAGRADARADRPGLNSIIMLGTPNAGSPFAKLRALSQVREQVMRWIDSENHNVRDLWRNGGDGDGAAGDDLMPGSAYLTDLNSRPLPPASEIPITVVIGRLATAEDLRLDRALEAPMTVRILGEERAAALLDACRRFTREMGDGVVTCSSACLEGADTAYVIETSHRTMIRTARTETAVREAVEAPPAPEPEGIRIVLNALAADAGPDRSR